MRNEDALRERMKSDPEFRRIWQERRPQFEIRRALIAARLEAGMTQEELAAAAGVPRSTITRLEAGEGNPTLATLQKLAGALNIQFTIDGEGIQAGRELAHSEP